MKSFTEWMRDYFKESISSVDRDWLYIPHKNKLVSFDEHGEVDDDYDWIKFLHMNNYANYLRENESFDSKLSRILDILEKR